MRLRVGPVMVAQERTEEHKIGALLLAVASLSAHGYVRLSRPTSAGWRVMVHSPRAEQAHRAIVVNGATLRDALEAAWTALCAQVRTGKNRRKNQP